MYLACYEPVNSQTNNSSWNLIAQRLQGTFFHCELVFIKDYYADSLILSSRCEEGFPVILKKRHFQNYKKPCNVHWFKFTNVSAEQELEVKRTAERLIASKQYRMNLYSMVGAGLPSFIMRFRNVLLEAYYMLNRLGPVKGIKEYEGEEEQTYCSQFIGVVLNESKVWPTQVDNSGTIQDLVVRLLQSERIEQVNSVQLLGHDSSFLLTEKDHMKEAKDDLQVTEKIDRAEDYF